MRDTKQQQQRNRVVAKTVRHWKETRQKLISQGRQLAQRRANNSAQCKKRPRGAAGRTNPSAHSTVPATDTNAEVAAQHSHSSVPERPKYSTVQTGDRLYGLRLHTVISENENSADTNSSAGPPSDAGTKQPTDQPMSDGDK
jgi:hypothetical protein